jgi:hypothetical protein
MVAVQIAVFRHVICDVGRLPAAIEFIADLMTGNDRRLRCREVDALGLQRCQEIVIDRVGMRGRGCYSHEADQSDDRDKAGRS